MDMEQVIRIQADLMLRRTWETRSPGIPDTPEARDVWDEIAVQLAEGHAEGWIAEILHEFPI